MKTISNEHDFQTNVISRLTLAGAHVQVLDVAPRSNGVPDLSVAFDQIEYWLELKYDEYEDEADDFCLRHMRRGQIDWLMKRHEAMSGRSVCGFLVLLTGPRMATDQKEHLIFIPAWIYREWADVGAFPSVSQVIINSGILWTDRKHGSCSGAQILEHIRNAANDDPVWL